MKKIVFVMTAFFVLVACSPMEVRHTAQNEIHKEAPNETQNPVSTLQIGDKELDSYTLWGCRENLSDDRIILEFVITDIIIEEIKGMHLGFVLFDNRDEYAAALYKRKGINHRWDWEEGRYAFVIKPDGTGIYYDFTNSKDGTTKASDVFECEKYIE